MKNKFLWWTLIGSALVLLAMLAISVRSAAAQGVGIFPTAVEFQDGLREGEYFRQIGVINGGDAERVFGFEAAGDIGDWLTVVDSNDRTQELETITAAPNSQARVLLRLRVPVDAPNGDFVGLVRVVALSEGTETGGAGSSVNIGAEVLVQASISGTQVIDGTLIDTSINRVEQGSPLRVRSTVQNLGNVRVEPQMVLEVRNSDGEIIFNEAFLQEPVPAEEIGVLVAEWDTTGQDEGEYTVKSTVTFGELNLGERESPFTILPFGTLTRQGELKELDLVLKPDAGDLGIMHAVFQNTGQIDTLAKFTGEFYQGEKLVDVLTSEEVLVLVGQEARLVVFPKAGDAGDYTIKGKVNYQGKETEGMELTFDVTAAATPGGEATAVPGTTPEATNAPDSTPVPEGTTPPAGGSSEPDNGGSSPLLIIVIIVAVVAGLGLVIFVGRKAIPGMRS